MGDNLRQDEPGMEPDRGRVHAKDDQPADTEGHKKFFRAKDDEPVRDTQGHGGGKWAGAKDEAPDEPAKDDDVEGHSRLSDVNLKKAVVPVRW